MSTIKGKRWNGKIETLSTDYLNDVLGQMLAYGERVQFSLGTSGPRPHYQVTNSVGKKMAFDSNNHLLHPKADEFAPGNISSSFTLEQIEAAIAGAGSAAARASRAGGASGGGTRTSAAKARDLIDAAKYEYFKNNRKTLPAHIGEHSAEITELMTKGMSAEDAFAAVVKRHF